MANRSQRDSIKVFETSPGAWSLTMDVGDETGVLEAAGYEPGGYTWEGVARTLVRTQAPHLEGRFGYDPEGSMFCAYGKDPAALRELEGGLRGVVGDAEALRTLMESADPEEFED